MGLITKKTLIDNLNKFNAEVIIPKINALNKAIEDKNNQINKLEVKINRLESELNQMVELIDILQDKISFLEKQLTNNTELLSNHQKQIEDLEEAKKQTDSFQNSFSDWLKEEEYKED